MKSKKIKIKDAVLLCCLVTLQHHTFTYALTTKPLLFFSRSIPFFFIKIVLPALCLFTPIATAIMDEEKIELVGNNSYGSFVPEDSSIDSHHNNKFYIYWLFLAGAILFEVMGTTMMKLSNGLTHMLPSVAIFLFYGCAFILMPLSLKRIELSTAYAIWSGVGTTLTCLIGVVHFGDTINPVKIVAIAFVVVGCAMLQVADSM